MKCLWCGTENHEDDHRCKRCGRRLRVARPQAAPDTYPIMRTSTAPRLERVAVAEHVSSDSEPEPRRQPAQTSLAFETESPRVIPMPSLPRRTPSARNRVTPDAPRTRRARIAEATNLKLALRDVITPEKEDASPRTVICGYARAASPMHRSLAAVLDWSMILIATGMFLLTFHLGGGELTFNKSTIPVFVAVPLMIALFYEAACALGGGTTVGMRWTRLRLLNFDGRKATTEECLLRVLGTSISMAAIGLGHLWALFDEENLAWQDHISKTFPTPSQIQHPF